MPHAYNNLVCLSLKIYRHRCMSSGVFEYFSGLRVNFENAIICSLKCSHSACQKTHDPSSATQHKTLLVRRIYLWENIRQLDHYDGRYQFHTSSAVQAPAYSSPFLPSGFFLGGGSARLAHAGHLFGPFLIRCPNPRCLHGPFAVGDMDWQNPVLSCRALKGV